MYSIQFSKYSSYYKVKKEYIPALWDINLCVERGQFVVIVGESGSGKSTLIKACLGMLDYYEGDLYLNGTPVENIKLKNGQFACVRQDIALYPNLTIYENLAFPLRIIRTVQSEVDKRVKEIAKLLDIELMLSRKPKHLSGGQQQRVAIGRALIKNPSFLFFDEPFSGIDINKRAEIRALVKQLHKQLGITILFVTHDIDEAFALGERIVVLENGKVVDDAPPSELRKSHKSALLSAHFDANYVVNSTSEDE